MCNPSYHVLPCHAKNVDELRAYKAELERELKTVTKVVEELEKEGTQ